MRIPRPSAWCLVALVLVATACSSSSSGARRAASPISTGVASAAPSSTTTTRAPQPTTTTLHPIHGAVNALGDSVMIDAASALRAAIPTIVVDAAVDRSAIPGPDLLAQLARSGQLGSEIVFDLGTNGGFTLGVLNRVLDVAAGRRVVMVTAHCPYCTSVAQQNSVMHTYCTPARDCYVADWDELAQKHPEWFASDGVHMPIGGPGARAFARLVRSKL
jgi:hypothetical protein